MKTTLLKKENILCFIAFAFLSMQSISALKPLQNLPDTDEELMKRICLEFNSVDGPEARRVLQLAFSENTSDDFEVDYDIKNTNVAEYDLNIDFNGEPMTEQAYAQITEDKEVNLLFQTSGSFSFTIRLTATENMEENDLHLKDNLYGTYFDLKSGEAYEFYSDEGNYPNRFQIVFKQQSETLSQIDQTLDGLDVRYLTNTNTLSISNPNNKKIKSIELYDILGKSVYSNRISNTENTQDIQLNNLATGAYIIRLITEENGIITKKIIAN
ncbi:T9SS type A sorting domain-containing protein [Winogradskyella sp.]|uniref:T9SS type A sorting domain-containing protein n=1 Tax=Winogradskyella sp. TaxID=1883156 RepID=UPI003F6D81CD